MSNQVFQRLGYKGDLKPVIQRIAEAYELGDVERYSFIEVGYEDCNVLLHAGGSKFLLKFFAATRTPQEIRRYVSIIRAVTDKGIRTAKLRLVGQDDLYTDATGLSLVVFDYIEGKTFSEITRVRNDDELGKILEQAAKINKLELKPTPLFDSWSVQNLEGIYGKIHSHLDQSDRALVEEAKRRFTNVTMGDLPHAFVHGDISKTNTILGDNGDIYIIDFAVANWYPRIQELAWMGANLLHDVSRGHRPQEIVPQLVEGYRKYGELTAKEEESLPDYLIGAIAMEFLGGKQTELLYGNESKETRDWIELGRKSLQQALES